MRKLLRLAVFAAAAVGGLAGLGVLAIHLGSDPLADARAYYDAASRLNAGQPLYPVSGDIDRAEFYRYPPLLAIVVRPFAMLPYPVFAVLWEAAIVAAFGATLWRLGLRRPSTWLLTSILAWSITWAISIGQAQVLVTWLVATGSPLGIALAGQMKLFPGLVALYWLGRRDWPALSRFVAFSLALVAVQLALEPRGSMDFLALTNLDQVGQVRNFSPYAVSPELWLALALAGMLATLALARTRWGWAAAVAFSTLVTPRLLLYMLGTLLTALRRPSDTGRPEPAVRDRAPDRLAERS